jgi:excinuclease UvrABC ATPase subunit
MPGLHKSVSGLENIDKLIEIDQSPIGRTPRSNPATYSGVFDQIRNLFSLQRNQKLEVTNLEGFLLIFLAADASIAKVMEI